MGAKQELVKDEDRKESSTGRSPSTGSPPSLTKPNSPIKTLHCVAAGSRGAVWLPPGALSVPGLRSRNRPREGGPEGAG